MNNRPILLTLSFLAVIAAASVTVGTCGNTRGSYKPINDLQDPHVQEIANYAVTEHNHKAGAKLVYVKIVKGESQVVAGTNYRLMISAKDGLAVRNYQAVIYEKFWDHYLNLTSFNVV